MNACRHSEDAPSCTKRTTWKQRYLAKHPVLAPASVTIVFSLIYAVILAAIAVLGFTILAGWWRLCLFTTGDVESARMMAFGVPILILALTALVGATHDDAKAYLQENNDQ